MRFNDNEYNVSEDAITIKKEALEKWIDHYLGIAKSDVPINQKWLYAGKAGVLIDLIKHFEEEEV